MFCELTTLVPENEPCVLEERVHIENLFENAIARRQEGPDEPSLLFKILSNTGGPPRNPTYNPSIGYEPYWPGGDWVFSDAANESTTATDGICGRPCPHIYKVYGIICAKNRDHVYKTFDNYCDLYNEDCTLRSAWLIVYRGPCQGELKTFPTKSADMATRAEGYLSMLEYNHPSTIDVFG